MLRLWPRDAVFFDVFEGMARHAVTAAEALRQLAMHFPQITDPIRRIRDEEHAADQLAHRALERLDRTFVAPLDRGDVHTLIGQLDDIIDIIDALAKRFPLLHVTRMEGEFQRQADLLVEATVATSDAVHRLRHSRKLSQLSDKLIEIHAKESRGDDNHHAAISRLFDGSHDVLEVIKWKELYDYVESALDACEDVGNTLERIVLKNG